MLFIWYVLHFVLHLNTLNAKNINKMEFTKTQIKDFYQVAKEHLKHDLYDQSDEWHKEVQIEYEGYLITFSGIYNTNLSSETEIDGSRAVVSSDVEIQDLSVWNEELDEQQAI